MVAGRRLGCIGTILGVIVILVALFFVFVYSGLYNVAATYPDNNLVAWTLGTTMDNSVRHHAKEIKVPPLDDPKMIQAGARQYREDCAICHGAPGVSIGDVGKGLNPSPPELTEAAGDWKPNELFWITKYGVRMTGMPAWTRTKSDKEIWQIVAFTQKLPKMTPASYKALFGATTTGNP